MQMLKSAHLGLFVALFLGYSIADAEASMNKCTDGKQITYTNEPCEKTGLKAAGPIKDSVTVVPAAPVPKKELSENLDKDHSEGSEISGKKVSINDDSGTEVPRAPAIKPVSPLLDKMLNWLH
jgi:hypothetical protein